jgi:hypothetical protein
MWVNGQRATVRFGYGLQTTNFFGCHVDEYCIFATTVGGYMFSGVV